MPREDALWQARHVRVQRRPVDELSDAQIETLISFGRREAEVIDEMVAAVRVGDRNLVWQLAEALLRLEDEALKVG